jgi:hypothetical protein
VPRRQRHTVEDFIRAGFRKAYGARIPGFLPDIMALYRGQDLVAACGLNPAAGNRLFLEIYLDASIERIVSRNSGKAVPRSACVEVGNLTVARAGYARHLITHLTAYLRARGPDWVVFSAVPALRNNFLRLGIPLVRLAPADPDRLPAADREAWGTYYDGAPQVTAVSVHDAWRALRERPCIR